jgi:spermidine synthase
MWNRHLLSRGKYHRFDRVGIDVKGYNWLEALFQGPEILTRFKRGELLYYGDGIGGFTTVLKYPDALGNVEYSMVNSGKIDASSRADMKTQTLSAHLPMLFHPNPRTVMVLGLASGVTAGEALYYPIEQLDVLEISHQVVEGSAFFRPWNNEVLSSPETSLIIQDGRAHLQLTKQKYDVIISEPSNPWMAGMATLFTRDFFTLVENRLNEGGIFCQWVHAYQMDWSTFALIGRTFAHVFPNSLLVSTEPSTAGNDYQLVGFKAGNKLALANAERNLSYIKQSENVALADPRLLYRLVLSEDLKMLFGQGPINRDNRPVLEFSAPKLMYHRDSAIARKIRAKRWLSPEAHQIIRQLRGDVDSQIDFAAYALSVYAPFPRMIDLAKATPSQEKRFFELFDTYCANNPVDYSVLKDEQLKARCRAVQIESIQKRIDSMPDKAASYFYLAKLYDDEGVLDEAIDNYSKSLQIKSDNADTHNNLGYALARQGSVEQAAKHFTKALRIKPDDAEVHSNLGGMLAKQGRFDEAIPHFVEALRINPNLADAHNNLGGVLILQGKIDEAIKHYTVVLHIDPNHADAHNNLGYALAQQGRLDEAIEHYNEALQINPDFADAHRNLGYALLQQGKLEGALTHLREAVRIEPNLAKTHNDLGVTLAMQGKFDEAVTYFTRALRIKPDYAEAQSNLGTALARQGKLDEAIAHFTEALRIKPDYQDARRGLQETLLLQKSGGQK